MYNNVEYAGMFNTIQQYQYVSRTVCHW